MTSMYNSIQHFNEFGVKTIEKTVRKFIKEGKDLVDCQRRTIFDPSEEFYFVKNSLANKQNSGLHYTKQFNNFVSLVISLNSLIINNSRFFKCNNYKN